MTIHVELENGQSAELREPATLTNGQRRPIVAASDRYMKAALDPILVRELQRAVATKDKDRQEELFAAVQLGVDDAGTLRVGEIAVTVLVVSWTLDLPIPSSMPRLDDDGMIVGSDVLDEISAWDYDRLQRAAGELLPDLRWSGPPPASSGKGRRSTPSRKR